MDGYETITTRRSIRSYIDKEITDETIKKLIEAAVSAPSAGNQQPWQFIIIDDQKIFDELIKIHPASKMLKKANKAILVCGDLNLETYKGYWMIDCSAATQNILLAAHSKNIGSCWIGIYPREERIKLLQKILATPENIIPFSMISLGYTEEKTCTVDRYEEKRIHYNKFQKNLR